MISVQGFINGTANYVKPKGRDANLGVWHFFCLNFVTESSARLLEQAFVRVHLYGAALSANKFADATKSLRPFFNFTAPFAIVNYALQGNYFKALAYLEQCSRAAKTLMKSETFHSAIKPTLLKVVPFANRVTTESAKYAIKVASQVGNAAWVVVDYRSLPGKKSVKELLSRSFVDCTKVYEKIKGKSNPLNDERLVSDVAKDLKELCETVESVSLFTLSFLGVIYATKLPSSVVLGTLGIIGASDITAHIASHYIVEPAWKQPFKTALEHLYKNDQTNQIKVTENLNKESFKNAFSGALTEAHRNKNLGNCQVEIEQMRDLIKAAAKSCLIELVQKGDKSEATTLLSPHSDTIRELRNNHFALVSQLQTALISGFDANSIVQDVKSKNAYISTQLLLAFSGAIDEAAKELLEEGIPQLNKSYTEKWGEYLADISNLRNWSKIIMLPLRVAQEVFGKDNAKVVAEKIHTVTTPLVLFRTPVSVIKPITEINFKAISEYKRETVLKVSESLTNFFYDGIKMLKWSLLSANVELKSWYSKENLDNVQNLWALFAFIGFVNKTYNLVYAGEEVEVKENIHLSLSSTRANMRGSVMVDSSFRTEFLDLSNEEIKSGQKKKKVHKNSIYEDWKVGKTIREIATTDRIIKSIEIIGGMAGCIMVGMVVLRYSVPYVESLKLASQVATFGPRMIHEFFQDQPNPAVA